ncbi:DUF1583 domain-containing protein [Planctomycetes bacterium K23_9]|uniref:Translocation protein TolB n=1 Tax=Stieleria marina TaxID=1930275 RepID=A0A517P0N7_9BACT|nr:translocation protein TolB [Planctomycetes bacterium K23_9]
MKRSSKSSLRPGLLAAAFVVITSMIAIDPTSHAQESIDAQTPIGVRVIDAVNKKDLESALTTLAIVSDENLSLDAILEQRVPAAAAAVHRLMVIQSSDQRYDALLDWSMPNDDHANVRVLAVPVPVDAPPKVFAREIGQRPKDETFQVADIAGIQGIFCSGWMLAEAADDLGRLNRLITQLQTLSDNKVVGSDALLHLAIAKSTRTDVKPLQAALNLHSKNFPKAIGQAELVVAAVAAAASSRSATGESALATLAALDKTDSPARSFLRTVKALATQNYFGKRPPTELYQQDFRYWHGVTGGASADRDLGAPHALWLTHENHLLHAAGGRENTLFFRYPLAGEFEFVAETQGGGAVGTDGGIAYGGLHFEANGASNQLQIFDAGAQNQKHIFCPFVRSETTPTFHRVSIRGKDGKLAMEANFHPMWTFDKASQSSPWLGLRSRGKNRPVFRNLTLSGSPTIPRSVALIGDNQLRGWLPGISGETIMSVFPIDEASDVTQENDTAKAADVDQTADWSVDAGVLTGRSSEAKDTAKPSWLRYERPLLKSEAITYQFKHGDGEVAVHPTLGRMAFLLLKDGVRVRWMTDHNKDWTGLAPDHQLLEPLSRRGPRPLPLKVNDWNDVRVAHTGDFVDISLNGKLIYHRKLDFEGDKQFGFYRPQRVEVQIRDAKLSGDWPLELPKGCFDDLLQLADATNSAASAKAANRSIGKQVVASQAMGFRRELSSVTESERYDRLVQWVLPCETREGFHYDFRLTGFLMPTNASLTQQADPAFQNWGPKHSKAENLFSPACDLVRMAASKGKLDEIQDLIDKFNTYDNHLLVWQKRAMQCLVACQRNQLTQAEQSLSDLGKMKSKRPSIDAEFLVASTAAQRFPQSLVVLDYLSGVLARRVKQADTRSSLGFKTQLLSLALDIQQLHADDTDDANRSDESPGQLIASDISFANTQSEGRTASRWRSARNGETHHVAGHDHERLYFPAPLTGNYTIEADLGPWSSTTVAHLGETIKPDKQQFGLAKLGQQLREIKMTPPLVEPKHWVRYRQELRSDLSSVFLNGRLVYERHRSQTDDPWLAFQGWWKGTAKFRDFQITGDALVPDQVSMSASLDLIGWTPYFGRSYNKHLPNWTTENENQINVIAGHRAKIARGCHAERLLRYHRPFVEDGDVEFDFFYRVDQTTASPALGRLAFLFQPEGVQEHWVTDGKYERTLARPEPSTSFDQDPKRRIPLPLLDNAWNQARLSVHDQTLSVFVNGQLVHERPIPSGLGRKFGLFYFADCSDLRVRDVKMRGDWPKELASLSSFANPIVESLDKHRESLPTVFQQALNRPAGVARYFAPVNGLASGQTRDTTRGREVVAFASQKWSQMAFTTKLAIQGDFDVAVGFEELDVPVSARDAGPRLIVTLNDELSRQLVVAIGNHANNSAVLRCGVTMIYPDGTPRYKNEKVVDESTSGRMRIVRQGDQAYFLFAQGDSPIFRLIAEYKVSTADVSLNDIQMMLINSQSKGACSVSWTDIKIHAQSIMQSDSPTDRLRSIAVLDLESAVTERIAQGNAELHHMGSPKWSADQKFLAYDRSSGSTTDSRLLVYDVANREETDIGFGSMPNFSADGKYIAFSAYRQGVGIMNADGSDRRIIDSGGWGIQWSPDPDVLSYAKGSNIMLWDVGTGKSKPLLTGAAAKQYRWFHWNMCWSRDGRKIVFKGTRTDGNGEDIAVASLDQSDRIQVLRKADRLAVEFSWTSDNRSVLVADSPVKGEQANLWKLPLDDRKDPESLILPDVGGKVFGAVWSPDAKKLALVVAPESKMVPLNADSVTQ